MIIILFIIYVFFCHQLESFGGLMWWFWRNDGSAINDWNIGSKVVNLSPFQLLDCSPNFPLAQLVNFHLNSSETSCAYKCWVPRTLQPLDSFDEFIAGFQNFRLPCGLTDNAAPQWLMLSFVANLYFFCRWCRRRLGWMRRWKYRLVFRKLSFRGRVVEHCFKLQGGTKMKFKVGSNEIKKQQAAADVVFQEHRRRKDAAERSS